MRLKRWVALLIAFIVEIFVFILIKDNGNTIELNAILSTIIGFCSYVIIREG